jgi:polar amino acid transport system substrate-binding protein
MSRLRGKWAAAAGVALLVVVVWWLLRPTLPQAVDPTWEKILATGEFRVCTDPSWPPFEFVDEKTGRIEGLDIDLAELIAKRFSPTVHAEIVPVGFDGLYDALLAGRCDAVLSALPYEPMRTEDVAYSVAYFNAGLVLLTREGTSDIETLTDLAGQTVGVEWGFVPEGDGRQRSFLNSLGLRRYDTSWDALRALQSGEVEAVLADGISALAYMRDCGGLQIVGDPISDLNYVIPVRPDSFQLLTEINQVLLAMRQDGTLEQLQKKWF